MTEPATIIREFFTSRLGEKVADDDDIFALGFVTSMFALELVSFIESVFEFEIPHEQLVLDNFRSVSSLTNLVNGRNSASA